MPTLETLQIIWWILLGVLLMGFTLTDGFDLGAASLITILGKTDKERRLIINTIAPIWESNQVWLILGAGAIFAAWPLVYAVFFSTMYIPMFLVLACLIIRPVGLKFRSKITNTKWTQSWDYALSISSTIPSFVFGVAVGNAIIGLPFSFHDNLMLQTQSYLLQLFNLFPILVGAVSLCIIVSHGAGYLRLKINHPLTTHAQHIQQKTARIAFFCFCAAILLFFFKGHGFILIKPSIHQDVLSKTVEMKPIFGNTILEVRFLRALIPATIACIGFVITSFFNKNAIFAFTGSTLSIISIIATTGIATFPFILPSTLSPSHSLTVWDASSSQLTLFIMLISVFIFLPIVLTYVIWSYRVFAKKLTLSDLNDPHMY